MIGPDDRVPVLTIWLLILLGAVQLVVWLFDGGSLNQARVVERLPEAIAWLTLVLLAVLVTRRGSALQRQLTRLAAEHQATVRQLEQLSLQNEMLRIVGSALDVPQAFQALAPRIERFVPCDRLGLALLTADDEEFQTFTARSPESASRANPRPEMVFRVEGTALGQVVRSRQPMLISDTHKSSSGFLDAIVLAGSGFHSALLVPLVAKGRAVGTLNMVSRRADAFALDQVQSVLWIAEILAVGWMAQQLQLAQGRYRTMEVMSELTLSIAAEINSALQAIIGHCDLLRREYKDERLRRDIDTVVRQAERIATLLGTMRTTTQERLQEVAATVARDDAG